MYNEDCKEINCAERLHNFLNTYKVTFIIIYFFNVSLVLLVGTRSIDYQSERSLSG